VDATELLGVIAAEFGIEMSEKEVVDFFAKHPMDTEVLDNEDSLWRVWFGQVGVVEPFAWDLYVVAHDVAEAVHLAIAWNRNTETETEPRYEVTKVEHVAGTIALPFNLTVDPKLQLPVQGDKK